MSTDIGNLVCDAVADPPRKISCDETSLKKEIHIQQQKNHKTRPEQNSEKCNNERSNQDKEEGEEEEEKKKPRPKSRKKRSSSSSSSSNCSRGMTINNVVSGSTNVCINFSNQTQINVNANGATAAARESKEASKEMPAHIKNLTQCQTTIATLDKLTVKQYVGDNWKKVAKNLDLKKSEVEQCLIDHSKEGIGEVMFQILTIWNHRYGKLATLGALMKALWLAEEYTCAHELAALHKSG